MIERFTLCRMKTQAVLGMLAAFVRSDAIVACTVLTLVAIMAGCVEQPHPNAGDLAEVRTQYDDAVLRLGMIEARLDSMAEHPALTRAQAAQIEFAWRATTHRMTLGQRSALLDTLTGATADTLAQQLKDAYEAGLRDGKGGGS